MATTPCAAAEDFAAMCERIKQSAVQRRLRWMIIVVAKSDLFWHDRESVRDYYIPSDVGEPSKFGQVLTGLTSGERTVPPRIFVVPFSSFPEAHRFAPHLYETRSRLDLPETTALLDGFYRTLEKVL